MSHNATAPTPPHVLSVSPASIIAAGATSITINGNNLSSSCQLSIPAAFGTVTGPGVYTASSGAQGDLVFPITALAPPGTATARACALSNGGTASTGLAVSVLHQEWSPLTIMVDPADTWVQASDASAVGDGVKIPDLTPGYGNRGDLDNWNYNYRAIYDASVPELNGEPGIYMPATPYHWRLTGLRAGAGYNVNPSTTAFTIAFCWASNYSATATYAPRFSSVIDTSTNSFIVNHYDDRVSAYSETVYHWLGGSDQGTQVASNLGTTAPRRLIISGDGTTTANSSLVEPVTGINMTATPGGVTPGASFGDCFIGGEEVWVAEMIFITGRELTTDEKTALNAYWDNKYTPTP